MNLNERNYAGDHLVVGSLEVLGDVKSANMQQIKNNLEQVRYRIWPCNQTTWMF